ncbi:MAG TPA: hypothetical protein VFW22_16410 [Pseudolabrys sp.]|nr:hypothetical protein [Pseudolabrys sp.]
MTVHRSNTGFRRRWLSGARGPGFASPDTAPLLARMTTPPSAQRAALYDQIMAMTASVRPKLNGFYLQAAHDKQAGQLNLLSASYTLLEVGSFAWIVDRGYTSDGATGYLDTQFNPTLPGSLVTQNAFSMGVFAGTDAISTAPICGNSPMRILPHTAANQAQARISSNTQTNHALPADTARGLSAIGRGDAVNATAYKDGVNLGAQAAASTALNAFNFLFLAATPSAGGAPTSYSPLRCVGGFFGGQLSDAEHATMANAFATWTAATGA